MVGPCVPFPAFRYRQRSCGGHRDHTHVASHGALIAKSKYRKRNQDFYPVITCKNCGHRFLSIGREHYPGGATTGITILLWSVGLFLVGLALCFLNLRFDERVLYLFATIFVLMGLLKLVSIPENRRMIKAHGGNICPKCDTSNELRWYD